MWMRARNSLERLATAGRPLLADADSLVDAAERDRILEWILASRRAPARSRRLRPALLLVGAAILAVPVAIFTIGALDRGTGRVTKVGGNHHLALTGPTIHLAGYHFRTPAGFKLSSTGCSTSPGSPVTNGFAAAASADGGCVEAAWLIGGNDSTIPAGAQPVDVGSLHGYFVARSDSSASRLYVDLNKVGGHLAYLVLIADGLTKDRLVAVAESGLPTLPLKPTTTTGTETG
jgi:hypothetical protein